MTVDYATEAHGLIDEGEFEEAGNLYTQASYQALSTGSVTSGDDHQIGAGLDALLRAALCYERAGSHERCRNRSEQGILVATDLQNAVLTDERRIAVLQEFVADFHGLGGLNGVKGAYQKALDDYEDAGIDYTIEYHSSPTADRIIGFTKYLVQWAENGPDEDVELVYDFAGRVKYKRREIEGIISSIGP